MLKPSRTILMPFDNNRSISDLVNNDSLVITVIEHMKRYKNKLFLEHKRQKLKITNQQ